VAQIFPAAISLDLKANIWFTFFGWRNSGLIRPDKSLRPAYTAYDVSESTLVATDYKSPVGGYPQVMGYKFNLLNGNEIWVVWATNGGPVVMNLPSVPLSIRDVMGVDVPVNGTTVTLTVAPYYLEMP
jgi:hypothetical protein